MLAGFQSTQQRFMQYVSQRFFAVQRVFEAQRLSTNSASLWLAAETMASRRFRASPSQ